MNQPPPGENMTPRIPANVTLSDLIAALPAGSDIAAALANFDSIEAAVSDFWTEEEADEIEAAARRVVRA